HVLLERARQVGTVLRHLGFVAGAFRGFFLELAFDLFVLGLARVFSLFLFFLFFFFGFALGVHSLPAGVMGFDLAFDLFDRIADDLHAVMDFAKTFVHAVFRRLSLFALFHFFLDFLLVAGVERVLQAGELCAGLVHDSRHDRSLLYPSSASANVDFERRV